MRTASLLPWLCVLASTQAQDGVAYVGTYTGPASKGIYAFRYHGATGTLQAAGLAAEIQNPSWLTVHPNRRLLYAVTEIGDAGETEAAVSSFAVDPRTGALHFLNRVASGGGGACHLAVDQRGHFIAVANYGSGNVAVFRLDPDGKLQQRTALVQFSGASANPKRQKGPHAHAVVWSPDNRFLFVPDLGTDRIMSYRFNFADGSLAPNNPPFASVAPGSGPRHFTFHPSGKFAYVLNEMGSRVTAFSYDAQRGVVSPPLEDISTLSPDSQSENNSAEIQVDRSGHFLYASNRGDDTIVVFTIDPKRGTLTKTQRVSSGGRIPRNFTLDPQGTYLLAANQASNNIVVFRVDAHTGRLGAASEPVRVPAPACIQFLQP